ncbi:GMC family oxidoreductase [Shewanella surugensis]|uniref:Choline dehydrogenase n=1 Tax=Shewanella surugensis TaxID=212020 RepID=A0ABT0LCQ1_9GAMM|nr:choline dehydrogenase [Shewanella surugensis]MCL1125435.1 choline dehydrogenase [Shewanella surugensis]
MYDYIIVGAGSAGCVLANRLSANLNVNVCLIEAGPKDTHKAIHWPFGILWMMRSKVLNWHYYTQSEKHLNDRRLFWPRGKTLGGCSASNAMIYTRGHHKDYDHWSALGNKGWSYAEMLPYFKRGQHQERGPDDFHGIKGPLNIQDIEVKNPLSQAFVMAGVQAGYKDNYDFNGKDQEGVGFYQVTQKTGKRCSAAVAYLRPAQKRANLHIIDQALVCQLEFEHSEDPQQVTGVCYSRKGHRYHIRAKCEVIVCGGTLNSPQLLMLSGIGDRHVLKQHGIVVKHDLPGVGRNLQDHLDIMLVYQCTQAVSYGLTLKNILSHSVYNLYQHIVKHRGYFSSNGTEAGGFVKSAPSLDIPDLQYHFCCLKLRNHGWDWRFMIGEGYSLHVCELRPKSRGFITLNSSDPEDKVSIEANYLSRSEDLDKMVVGVKACLHLLEQPAFKPYQGKRLVPDHALKTDDDIRQFIQAAAETIYHPVGSCKMGSDNMAVVNERLQVHGIRGLRVVDASIMPTLIGGNTNAPTMAIAEKAADMILEQYGIMSGGRNSDDVYDS